MGLSIYAKIVVLKINELSLNYELRRWTPGSINSSNSKRLVEVGKNAGCRYSQLIDNVNDIDWRSISGSESIGLTAGASAPEILINQVIEEFKKRFKATIEFVEITKEDIQFKIPNSIRN